jgi:hypothetical protein
MILSICTLLPAHAQNTSSASLPDAPKPQPASSDDLTLRNAPRNFLHDQEMIWTSPAHLRAHDLEWLMPLAAAAGTAFATDTHTMTQVVSQNSSFNNASVNTSDVLVGSLIAVPVGIYGFGLKTKDTHAREAGYLSGESMVDALTVGEVLKLVSLRERPNVDGARGHFYQTSAGIDSSFPSEHSIIAWSAASSLAAEYPTLWKQIALYSAATGVSLTRVMGQQHFPSDVLVGSSLGWLIGHEVVARHHRRLNHTFH